MLQVENCRGWNNQTTLQAGSLIVSVCRGWPCNHGLTASGVLALCTDFLGLTLSPHPVYELLDVVVKIVWVITDAKRVQLGLGATEVQPKCQPCCGAS